MGNPYLAVARTGPGKLVSPDAEEIAALEALVSGDESHQITIDQLLFDYVCIKSLISMGINQPTITVARPIMFHKACLRIKKTVIDLLGMSEIEFQAAYSRAYEIQKRNGLLHENGIPTNREGRVAYVHRLFS